MEASPVYIVNSRLAGDAETLFSKDKQTNIKIPNTKQPHKPFLTPCFQVCPPYLVGWDYSYAQIPISYYPEQRTT